MKKISMTIAVAFIVLRLSPGFLYGQTAAITLPVPVLQELKHLEETYRVLDQVAEKIWPGWKGYRDVPMQFHFENGLVLLIGHPQPPPGFEPLPEIQVAGKAVHVDRRNLSALELKAPLAAGGGVIPFGFSAGGEPIRIVDMTFSPANTEKPQELPHIAERQILIYIHELFHCFQSDHIKIVHGNLLYNPDAAYAFYSRIEGLALEKAYLEKDDAQARTYLHDFLLARKLKRQTAMTVEQGQEEASDDLREGTAVYSEARTLEILRAGFVPGLASGQDSYYSGFSDIDFLFSGYLDQLHKSLDDLFDAKGKCYPYGCLQALLLQRWQSGWQKPFADEKRYLDAELAKVENISGLTEAQVRGRWDQLYDATAWQKKCAAEIGKRDRLVKSVMARRGQTYIVDFKPIQQYIVAAGKKTVYRLGLIEAYPDGIDDLKVNEIALSGLVTPVEKRELYFLRIVDTKFKKGQKPFTLTYTKKSGDDIYLDAVIRTPLFTLQAPKVQIRQEKERVKFILLARVHEV